MKNIFLLILGLLISNSFYGQYTISGKVINSNGEPLIQASVFLVDTYHAAISNDKGEYVIENVPEGEYTLKVSYVGYSSFVSKINVEDHLVLDVNLGENVLNLDNVVINASRVENDAAFTFTNLNKDDLEKENLGQDVPFLLRWTPAAVVTSDAGTGIGYTGIRLRGSDATSINVTINGVPLNDAESHGVFWVDLPDFMTSVDDVQIQRGVGTSTNGVGAFGGTISLNTNQLYQNPYAHVNTSVGSFGTRKLSVNLGTGLLNNMYSIDGRYSIINSDGFIDRGSADLKSWFFSASRIGKKSSLKLLAFSGHERTYQAWNGVPESVANGNEEELQAHYNRNYYSPMDSINLFESGRSYNYYTYEDQVDDYQQDHYQLHYDYQLSSVLKVKASLHYTRGFGYFEEFKPYEDFFIYDLPETYDGDGNLIASGDLVRRRWLDNDFYGGLINSVYDVSPKLKLYFGGGYSMYKGMHFGNVVSAEGISNVNLANKYYEGFGDKSDANVYLKAKYSAGKLDVFTDFQLRAIEYTIGGVNDDLTPLDVQESFSFFNPKFGITYHIQEDQNIYASIAVANKEPKRDDFIENLDSLPTHETLYDLEAGYRLKSKGLSLEWNNYFMKYNNQLVLTGDVNQSGAFKKINAGKSYRIGTEITVGLPISSKWFWDGNIGLSSNKLESFVEKIESYSEGQDDIYNNFENTDISFSPSIVASNSIGYKWNDNLEVALLTKYVGKQFLDNTSNESRTLPAYSFSNLRIGYNWDPPFLGRVLFTGMVNNILDAKFSSNGYTFSYYYEEVIRENYVYPQAGIHFMIGMNVEF